PEAFLPISINSLSRVRRLVPTPAAPVVFSRDSWLLLVPQRERLGRADHFLLAASGEADRRAFAGLDAEPLGLLDLLALLGPAGADAVLVDLVVFQCRRDEPPARAALLRLVILDPHFRIGGHFHN